MGLFHREGRELCLLHQTQGIFQENLIITCATGDLVVATVLA